MDQDLENVGFKQLTDAPISEKNILKNISLDICNLSYAGPKGVGVVPYLKQHFPSLTKHMSRIYFIELLFGKLRRIATLHRINFKANGGEITALYGPVPEEIKTCLDLIVGHRKFGTFDGNIVLNGLRSDSQLKLSFTKNSTYVPKKAMMLTGLSFRDTIYYAARLRLINQSKNQFDIDNRVNYIIELMDLKECQNLIVPDESVTRGEMGCNLRLLGIAMEIITLPPLIVIDEPDVGLEPGIAIRIFESLQRLKKRGHIIILGMNVPHPFFLQEIDKVVLINHGYSLYSSSPKNIQSYYCSKELGFCFRPETYILDFIVDIANGIERAEAWRNVEHPSILQEKFELSTYFDGPSQSEGAITAFGDRYKLLGYFFFDRPSTFLGRTWVQTERCIRAKLTDTDTLRKYIGSVIVVPLVVGYLQYQHGNYGVNALNLVGLVYANTANTTAALFFSSLFPYAYPLLNVQVICQKIRVFKFEQANRVVTTLEFMIATIISEIPFLICFLWIFGTIFYFMVGLGFGAENYLYFVGLECMVGIVGYGAAFLFAVVLRYEVSCRNTFFLCLFLQLLLTGYVFQFPTSNQEVVKWADINPNRWTLEALLSWKFNQYVDGTKYLTTFGFESFNHWSIFQILGNFILFQAFTSLLFLFPFPMTLSRAIDQKSFEKKRFLSQDSELGSDSIDGVASPLPMVPTNPSITRKSLGPDTTKPLLFSRESSTGLKSKLSIRVSEVGDEVDGRGPTVRFRNLSYKIQVATSPFSSQIKPVLQEVSGQFDWGKLSCILGASGSGKSSLLHILGGDMSFHSTVSGNVYYNRKVPRSDIPLWHRCALIESHDELFDTLTVHETLVYAMKLRVFNALGLRVLEDNITTTLNFLDLQSVKNKRIKDLTPGERRRVSIGEEFVSGPSLLLMDEPLTGLSLPEEVVLMSTFREMVNQDRTVVATLYQPSPSSYKLFDTVLLLSQGRVIYHGSVSNSSKYFINSPYSYDMNTHTNNPADFLTSISAGCIKDGKGEIVSSQNLHEYFKTTDQFKALGRQLSVIEESDDNTYSPFGELPSSSKRMVSLDMGSQSDQQNQSNPIILTLEIVYQSLKNFFIWKKDDLAIFQIKIPLLFMRACRVLIFKYDLIFSSIILHILLACLFGWVMGNSYSLTHVYNATSFFAVSLMMLFLANIQFIQFLTLCCKVFLKEHSRGLYTNFSYWLVGSIPLYILRLINALSFELIAYFYSNINNNQGGAQLSYFLGINILAIVGSTMMSEFVVFGSADVRNSYLTIPAMSFSQFAFSGIFVKFQSMPNWLQWVSNLSMIGWAMEGCFINFFQDRVYYINSNSTSSEISNAVQNNFPVFPNGYSVYYATLQLFSWTGGTTMHCVVAVVLNFFLYRILAFIVSGASAYAQKGGRNFLKVKIDEH